MIRSLTIRLFLALLLVAILSIALVTLLAGWGTLDQFWRYVSAQTLREQQSVAAIIENQVQEGGLESLDSLAEALRDAFGRDITLTDPEGDVLFSSRGEVQVVEERLVVEDGQISEAFDLTYHSDGKVGTITLAEQDPASDQALPVTKYTEAFFGSINRIFLLSAVIAIVLAGGASLLLAQRIIRPIQALTEAASELEGGDFGRRVAIQGSDELARLGGAFNSMAESLQRQEMLRRHMVTDAAHELRTPLANVYGYLEAIQDGVIQPDRHAMQSLMEETEHLNALVDDLQDLSLAEAGELRLEIIEVDVGALIRRVVDAQRPFAQARGIDLQIDLAPDLPLASADPGRTAQILHNLVSNSMTHTSLNGRIAISAQTIVCNPYTKNEQMFPQTNRQPSHHSPPATHYIKITVRDNGPGIPQEHQDHVFERFYRADSAHSRATGGSGLGLAICKLLVEAQDGQIWLQSVEGQGTAVTFTLPTAM